MSQFKFETTSDEAAGSLKDQISGKTILITGASPKSLGADASRAIASQKPGLLILAGRNRQGSEETKSAILKSVPHANIRLLDLDLGSQSSIKQAAAEVSSYSENIDVLINNAGVMATPFDKTPEGIELQFGTNHIGHFLFTNLILKKINDGGRIVNVTSKGYELSGVRYDDHNFEKEPYNKWTAYGQSKTANILFSRSIARKLSNRGITSYSLHPGTILTNLGKFLTPEDYEMLSGFKMQVKELPQGAATIVVAAFDPSIKDSNGGFMVDCQIEPEEQVAAWAKGVENEDKLWALSEKLVGQNFQY